MSYKKTRTLEEDLSTGEVALRGGGPGLNADLLDGKQLAVLETEYQAYTDQAETDAKAYTDTHKGRTDNPHAVTKAQVGLGNVTDDAQIKLADKATTTEAQAATAGKYPDAADVHAAFRQYGLGGNTVSADVSSIGSLPSGLYYRGNGLFSTNRSVIVAKGGRSFAIGARNGKLEFVTSGDGSSEDDKTHTVYGDNNILGTVSQSAGVPTGAIIENGSNANGAYTKFADGTMICTRRCNPDYSSITTYQSFQTPAVFVGHFNSSWGVLFGISGTEVEALADLWVESRNANVWAIRGLTNASGSSPDNSADLVLTAIGKWF